MTTESTITTDCLRIEVGIPCDPDALWRYVVADGRSHAMAAPRVEIDGVVRCCTWAAEPSRGAPEALPNGCIAHRWTAAVGDDPDLRLTLEFRVAPDSPVLRFRYHLHAATPRHLTKVGGRDRLSLLGLDVRGFGLSELRLSQWDEMIHSYVCEEEPIPEHELAAGTDRMGPILLAADGDHQLLIAYEHGSTHPDRFLELALDADRRLDLRAVKGSYWSGQPLGTDGYTTPWCQLAAMAGDRDALASAYRHFVLERFALSPASRQPWIFSNTWNYQERRKHWYQDAYLSEMDLERMLAEIEVAARMGIEVFVIDTGWYQKTGDWQVSAERFPDGLHQVVDALRSHGMRLGLWFAPGTVALSSQALAEHRDCIRHVGEGEPRPHPVWETEDSLGCCLSSRYGMAFADELIRLNRELGVSYFKWDAVGQYGCDRPGHGHGEAEASAEERALCYAFQQPQVLAEIAERVSRAVPDAICDFDVTEGGRSVGLAFLASSKYFLINNGPYFHNYDSPNGADGNSNLFFHPGQARPRICRSSLGYDRWIPSVLFLTHYLPDDPAANQETAIASLVLGHNGIWGDLCALSDEGVARFGQALARYKQVRRAITTADPVRRGRIGGDPEVHEKLDAAGRGAVALFANRGGGYRHVTGRAVDPDQLWTSPGLTVTIDERGHAVLEATFDAAGARLAFFGVDPEPLLGPV